MESNKPSEWHIMPMKCTAARRSQQQSGDSASNSFAQELRAYISVANAAQDEQKSWDNKPEIPSPNEILAVDEEEDSEEVVDLVPNHIHGPWDSTELYLKTHYELLREDAVAPLRDAVAYVRQNPRMKDTQDVCIYEKVYIIGLTCASAGVAARVRFSTARAGKNIVWEYSKRLITGNIVALTPVNDGFQSTCVVGIVAARPLDALKAQPPEVDIFFARPDDADFDPQREWLMVEAKVGYYEACRHSMTALQKMTTEKFPLSDQLCSLTKSIEAPDYIKENPILDMSSIYTQEEGVGKVDVLGKWPPPPEKLDASQWSSLKQILTKKLSIVQGPPGTGKTYVSVVALKALLSNMQKDDPPIIIAAQTNHALDQLLRHVAEFEPEYVRVGGRSTDLDIRKRTLYELGRKCVVGAGNTLGAARRQLRALIDKLGVAIGPLKQDNASHPLSASLFLKLGLITKAQYDSLLSGAEGWVHGGDRADAVSAWLGNLAAKFEVVYKAENFGFVEEEIDLEYEQLKELEQERGLDDDDVESLKGDYLPLKEGFYARRHHTISDKGAQEKYLKCNDMWKIPAFARGAVYSILQKQAKEKIRESVRSILKEYKNVAMNVKVGRWERQGLVLQNTKIIGMTTTGLSKYRALVSSLKPKIVLIEEAAEVIEAPVAAACVDSLQHLVLVGDHQQLQGQCALQELEGEPFYLNISMFERLIHNGVAFKRLSKQRRMIPEIRQIIDPIYTDLQDHPSVQDRPSVPGMGNVNSYFFCHTWPESSDSLMSKYNEDEAKMVVGFYLYLCHNGVDAGNITVLTFYNGQRKKILKALKECPQLQGQYIRVATVDSYQGEENEIVLLSLVRSNEKGAIGFLSIENRVCVALSRARRGFYIFGNAESLAVMNSLWWEVVHIMRKSPKRIGYYLPLTCSKHQHKVLVRNGDIFSKLDGGCLTKCGEMMSCGHQCPLRCHVMPHSQVRCLEECIRKLPCGHKCTTLCFQECKCSCGPAPSSTSANETEQKQQSQQHPPNGPWTFRRKFTLDQDHTALVERYREYANGGSKREDMKLTAVVRGQAAKEDELKRADNESFEALFGNHADTEKKAASASYPASHFASRAGKNDGVVEGVINNENESPIRRKYMQYYSTGGHVRTESEKIIGKSTSRTEGGKVRTNSLVDVD